MAFICPRCARSTLEIQSSINLPGDDNWDEIAVQLAVCQACGLQVVCRYEESRRGNLQDEAWQHIGKAVESRLYRQLEERLQTCPSPGNHHCRCEVHQNTDWESYFSVTEPWFQMVR